MAFTSTPEVVNSNNTWRLVSAGTTNSNLVNGSGTRLNGFLAINTSGSSKYLKFYDKATAPTVGTDTPKITILIPANTLSPVYLPFGDIRGVWFSNGLGIGITGAVGDSDSTNISAGDIYLTVIYASS